MNFEKIKNDEEIIEIYQRIKELEEKNKGLAYHDYHHVMNVTNAVEQILKKLNYEEEFIEEAKIAAIMHDTGCTLGKENHPLRSYEYAKDYFKRKEIKLKYEELVLEAILNHSNKFETDNKMTLALILADKIDIKRNRITEEGCKVEGNRQYQYIQDITIEIRNHCLEINFVCDEKIDLDELEAYYFTIKVFKAIQSFSNKMNLEPKVLINGAKWNSFYTK